MLRDEVLESSRSTGVIVEWWTKIWVEFTVDRVSVACMTDSGQIAKGGVGGDLLKCNGECILTSVLKWFKVTFGVFFEECCWLLMETFRIESRRVLGDPNGRIGFVFSLLPIAFKLGVFSTSSGLFFHLPKWPPPFPFCIRYLPHPSHRSAHQDTLQLCPGACLCTHLQVLTFDSDLARGTFNEPRSALRRWKQSHLQRPATPKRTRKWTLIRPGWGGCTRECTASKPSTKWIHLHLKPEQRGCNVRWPKSVLEHKNCNTKHQPGHSARGFPREWED